MSCSFCPSLVNKQFTLTNGDCEHVFVLKYQWISVKDQLPEIDAWVLCNGKNHHAQDDNALLVARLIDNGESILWCSVWGPQLNDVTHWMPLPRRPE